MSEASEASESLESPELRSYLATLRTHACESGQFATPFPGLRNTGNSGFARTGLHCGSSAWLQHYEGERAAASDKPDLPNLRSARLLLKLLEKGQERSQRDQLLVLRAQICGPKNEAALATPKMGPQMDPAFIRQFGAKLEG